MHNTLFELSHTDAVIALFTRVFTASEGREEGDAIGKLVTSLVATTAPSELLGCVAVDGDAINGCIFFSRFIVPSGQSAFILSPVAVDCDMQGRGVGQQLIGFGLDKLRSQQVELVFTYGDPAYYSKVGFQPLSEDIVGAPHPLSQPIGWLAQSLDGGAIQAMSGPTQCVQALSDPEYW